jgi:hypothetical protein
MTERFTTPEIAARVQNMQSLTADDEAAFSLYKVTMKGGRIYFAITDSIREAQLMALKVIGKDEDTGCAEDFENSGYPETVANLVCGVYVDERVRLVNEDEYQAKVRENSVKSLKESRAIPTLAELIEMKKQHDKSTAIK